MIRLTKIGNVVNRWMGARVTARRGSRNRRRWAVEALEVRTLLTMPLYVQQTGADNPMNGVTSPDLFDVHPTLADLDGDSDLDLIVGRANGISYFENVGNVSAPNFTERTGAQNPFASLEASLLAVSSAPAVGDWDDDGDLDLLLASFFGLTAYENTGSAATPSFVELGVGNPFDGLYTSFAIYPAPAFGDMDGDGDLDLVVSRLSSRMAYYRNVGTATSPSYNSVAVGDPFSSVVLGSFGSPALGDVDGDGDIDLVAGSFPVSEVPPPVINCFENTGTATAPQLTRVNDVFQGQFSEFTFMAAPALGDLDGDGDQDILVALAGEPSGEVFQYYRAEENPVAFKPVNTVPGFQLAHEDVAVFFSVENGNAISVADPNSDGDVLQVTLSVDSGKLTLAKKAGLDFSFSDANGTGTGDGKKDATMTFRGPLEKINAALDGLKFQPAVDFAGSATLTITTNDLGQPDGGAALSDTDSVSIEVLSVATQVEQLQLEVTLMVEFNGLNQTAANILLSLLDLTGHPAADAVRIKAFMVVVRIFAHVGILTDGTDLFLLERAEDILKGIKTH